MRSQHSLFTKGSLPTTALGLVVSFLGSQHGATAGSVWTTFEANAIGTSGTAPTGGNVTQSAEFTGSLFAAGNLSSGSSFTVGSALPTGSTAVEALGNNNNSSINVDNGGNVILGGTNNGHFNLNGGGTLTQNSTSVLGLAQSIYTQTQSAASYFSNLSATGTVTTTGSSPNLNYSLSYSGPTGGLAVYKLDASVLDGSSNINLSALSTGHAGTVVIDVTGIPAGFNFNNTNFGGDFGAQYASKIIFDFGTYSGTFNNSRESYGSILAPDAVLANTNAIDGSVWVQSIAAQGEVHYTSNGYTVQYNGFDPNSSVPEPSTLVLASVGIFFAGLYQWTRKRYRLNRLFA